ncbi:unnamed protein product [Porites lobata]|uniref:RNA helicase n=1 Tax=Porites lobata TaxID=104759 RepID=A0ABN8PRX1_9CNID|nr:unnamed protein product [Porites lobata]
MHNVAKVFVGRVTGSFLCAEKPKIPENRLVGIYHSMTLPKYRTRVSYSLKDTVGQVRIVVATSDLSMGVNFPDVGDVIHTGPARSVIDASTPLVYHRPLASGHCFSRFMQANCLMLSRCTFPPFTATLTTRSCMCLSVQTTAPGNLRLSLLFSTVCVDDQMI